MLSLGDYNMKAYAMPGLNKTGWIEKERPVCGPCAAILRPIARSLHLRCAHRLGGCVWQPT